MPDKNSRQPDQIVDSQGKVQLGIFPATVTRINGREADYRTPMGKPGGGWRRRFHYKQFQYFGIISDSLMAGCALADTGWLGLAFFYLFDPETGELTEHTFRSPLAGALKLSDSPTEGVSRFRQPGVEIELGYQREDDGSLRKTLLLNAAGIEINAAILEPVDYQPMSICTRTGINGWVYANKVAGLPVTGRIARPGREIPLAGDQYFGHHDFSAGFMRRETFWNWACLSGDSDIGHIGLNVSCGVNETSYTENCLWLNNQLIKIDTTVFEYDRDDLFSPWQIYSVDGKVALRFTPLGRHREKMNLGIFASNFSQLFGHFEGQLKTDTGDTIELPRMHGFVEEQYAKW